jgi:hypothetical protein
MGGDGMSGYSTGYAEETIGLRGYFTQEVRHKLSIDNTCVIGCPSYYETGRDRVIVKPDYTKSLRIGTSIGVGLYGIGPVYLQDKLEENIIKALCFDGELSLRYKQLKILKESNYRFFTSITNWKEDIKNNIDYYVGTRVHGSMVAMNSGVPTVVMNGDSRSKEMCEYMNIPHHPELFGCKDVEKILSVCEYDQMNSQYNQKFDIYVDFLAKNGLKYNPIEHDFIDVDVNRNKREVSKEVMSKAYLNYLEGLPKEIVYSLYRYVFNK